MGNRNSSYLLRASVFLITLFSFSCAFAQSKEKPKLKDFGSSLKRIKWDDEKKAAVEVKPKSTSASPSDDIDVVKVDTSLVTSDVLVLDARGNPVAGLTQKDFVISEDGKPQDVGMLSPGDDLKVPRSIVLIIDYSASQLPFITTSVAAAKTLVDKLAPLDSMAIVTDDVELIQDFTKDKKKLKHKLDSLLGRLGHSKQYSALFATLREAFNVEDQRPIVIFQTDGDQLGMLRNSPLLSEEPPTGLLDKRTVDSARRRVEAYRTDFSLEDIYRAAEKGRTTIYTVIPGHQMLGRPLEEAIADTRIETQRMLGGFPHSSGIPQQLLAMMTDERLKSAAENRIKMQAALASVATSTGGWTMFLGKPSDADHIYSSIFSDINRRYIVGYYPTNKVHDGQRRRIEVTVRDHPAYVIVGRKWYYAPVQDQ